MAAHLLKGLIAACMALVTVRAADPSPEALMEAGHWKRAQVLIEQRYATNKNDAYSNYLLARYKEAAGDADGAQPLAEKACALDSGNARYHLLLSGIYGRKAESASVFSQLGLARRFKKEAETAIALDPMIVEARMDLIEFYLRAPGIVGGDKAKARSMAEEIMKIDPARGYLAQARLASFDKQTGQLENLYKKAVEANPRDYGALMNLASFYSSDGQKKLDLAEKCLRDAVKLSPDRAPAFSGLAGLLASQERWQELEAILSQVEKDVPDNLYPYYRVGLVLLSADKDLPRAERSLRKYLMQEPELGYPTQAHAYWRLGLVLEREGRKPEAIAALETSVRLKPDLDAAKKDLRRLK